MNRALKAMTLIDLPLLLAVFIVRRATVEWLSWPQRRLERLAIAAYAGSLLVAGLMSGSYGWGTADILIAVCVSLSMWVESDRPEAMRVLKMVSTSFIAMRVSLVLLVVLLTVVILMASPHLWRDLWFPLNGWALVLFHYLTSLPSGGEGRGRRRKLALAELKKLFGWLPEPLPAGA